MPRGGGDIFFIPPEFYGLTGLGKGLKGIGQGLQQRQMLKQQEKDREQHKLEREQDVAHRDRQFGLQKEQFSAQEAARNFRETLTAAEASGVGQEGIRDLMVGFRRLPQDVQTVPDPEERRARAVNNILERQAGGEELNSWEQMQVNQFYFDDPLADRRVEEHELNIDLAEGRRATLQRELENATAADEAADAFLPNFAPEFVGSGVLGFNMWRQMTETQEGSALTAARIKQMAAQSDLSAAQMEALVNAPPELGQAGNSFATEMMNYVGGLVDEDTLTRYVIDPNTEVPEGTKPVLDAAAERIRTNADAIASRAINEGATAESDRLWSEVEALQEVFAATQDDAMKEEYSSLLNAKTAEWMNSIQPGVAGPQTEETSGFAFWKSTSPLEQPTFRGMRGLQINEAILSPVASAMLRQQADLTPPGATEVMLDPVQIDGYIQEALPDFGSVENMIAAMEGLEYEDPAAREQMGAVLERLKELPSGVDLGGLGSENGTVGGMTESAVAEDEVQSLADMQQEYTELLELSEAVRRGERTDELGPFDTRRGALTHRIRELEREFERRLGPTPEEEAAQLKVEDLRQRHQTLARERNNIRSRGLTYKEARKLRDGRPGSIKATEQSRLQAIDAELQELQQQLRAAGASAPGGS